MQHRHAVLLSNDSDADAAQQVACASPGNSNISCLELPLQAFIVDAFNNMRRYVSGNKQHDEAWDSRMNQILRNTNKEELMQWLDIATKMLLAVDEHEKFLDFLTYVKEWTSAEVPDTRCSSYDSVNVTKKFVLGAHHA